MISRIICVRINCNLSKSCATNASSPGDDASSRQHCQLGTRCPSWQYSCIKITQKGRLQQMESALFFFERLEFLSDTNNKRYMILVTLTSCFSPLLFLFSCRVQRPNELVGKVSANLCVRGPKADRSLSNGIPCHLLNHFRQIL